jgi:hypothetical protein
MILKASPRKILNIHATVIFLLLFANALGIVSKLYLDHDYVYGIVPLFDFNQENNIPTLFSSIMLIACSALLYLIAINNKTTKSSYIPWLGLSFIFLFLSIDEINSIHERFTATTREDVETSGLLYYAWAQPYGVALIPFIFAYSKFLLNLPKKIMYLFLLSGLTFVSGAIGFDLLGGNQAEAFGTNNLLFSIYYTFEELLEMLGVAIFIYTLLIYIVSEFDSLRMTVTK